MGKRAEKIQAIAFRAKCRELLAAGYSVSAIAKTLDKSYTHTKRICEQVTKDQPHDE